MAHPRLPRNAVKCTTLQNGLAAVKPGQNGAKPDTATPDEADMIIRAQLMSCGKTCWQDRKPVAKHQHGQTAYQRWECTSVNLLVWWR